MPFHLHEVLEQEKLTEGKKNQDSCRLWVGGWRALDEKGQRRVADGHALHCKGLCVTQLYPLGKIV